MCAVKVRAWGPAPITAKSIWGGVASEFACMRIANLRMITILIIGRSIIKFTPLESKQQGCSAPRDSIVRKSSETRFRRDFCPSRTHYDAQKRGFLAHRNENRPRKVSGRSSVGPRDPSRDRVPPTAAVTNSRLYTLSLIYQSVIPLLKLLDRSVLDAHIPKKPGFLPHLRVQTKFFPKKTGFVIPDP